MNKILLVLCLLVILFVSVVPVSAEQTKPHPLIRKTGIYNINEELGLIEVLESCKGLFCHLWWVAVIDSTNIYIAGESGQGSFEDLSIGQEITYTWYDDNGVNTAEKITIMKQE